MTGTYPHGNFILGYAAFKHYFRKAFARAFFDALHTEHEGFIAYGILRYFFHKAAQALRRYRYYYHVAFRYRTL